jgi:hypothetical protein
VASSRASQNAAASCNTIWTFVNDPLSKSGKNRKRAASNPIRDFGEFSDDRCRKKSDNNSQVIDVMTFMRDGHDESAVKTRSKSEVLT